MMEQRWQISLATLTMFLVLELPVVFFPMVVDFKRLPVPNGGLLNVFNLGGLLLI